MTATAEVIVPIPQLLPHQASDMAHPARFKVLRKGRRWGKDRLAFHVAWFGHGPGRCWPGILDGWDVAWLAPDHKQGRGIWVEEVVPRFSQVDIPGVNVNLQDRVVALEGCGGLYFYSDENIKAIRGLGKRLKGVIINEAAHLDLSYAWRDVIRPALMDNHGWAIIMSTTNCGPDGGLDEQGNKRIPSYFNTLCDEIQKGERDPVEWMESYGVASENPKIGPGEFASLVSEYPQGSVALDQEVYAKLLTSGAGVAFPEWRDDKHVTEAFTVPKHWQYGGGFDWGYVQPSILTICAHGEESNTVVVSDHRWQQKDGFEVGEAIADVCLTLPKDIEYIASDSSIASTEARRRGFPNLGEEIQSGIMARWAKVRPNDMPPVLQWVPKGHDSRLTRVNLLHKYLKWRDAEGGAPAVAPRLRFLRSCTQCVSTIPKLPVDPTKPEDVDTTADDHAYDALTYFLLSRPSIVDVPRSSVREPDTHPGIDVVNRKPRLRLPKHLFGNLDHEHEWVPSGEPTGREME